MATRIALKIEYNGAEFSGWQKQKSPKIKTVQGHVETALSRIADSPIEVICAGRTDSGVHATSQIVHFDSPIDRGAKAWEQGVNSLLPNSIRVLKSESVSSDFHARFSALHRRYNYIVNTRRSRSAFISELTTHYRQELDLVAMNQAASYLVGEQDFSSFRAAGCQSKTPNRNVISAKLHREGDFVVLDICANAFLQHMVRNIMGSLFCVGSLQQEPQWIQELLAAKDRTLAAMTAPPEGLYLVEVGYSAEGEELGKKALPPLLLAPH